VRGSGLGKALMAEALRRVERLAPGQSIKIAAQRRLEKFYLEFGFRTVSEPYEEDGITHVDMLR
jgi:ElaA protein